MKALLIGLTLIISVSSFGNEVIEANRNCDITLNMDQSYIDLTRELLEDTFIEKGYTSNFIQVELEDFPLEQEFMLMAGYERKGFSIEAEVRLIQTPIARQGGSFVFSSTEKGFTRKSSLSKALKSLPACILN